MQINSEVITGILGFVGAFLIKEIWDVFRTSKEKKASEIDESLKNTTTAVNDLKIAVVELKIRIDHLTQSLVPIPKLQSDLNSAHEKIRDIQKLVTTSD